MSLIGTATVWRETLDDAQIAALDHIADQQKRGLVMVSASTEQVFGGYRITITYARDEE